LGRQINHLSGHSRPPLPQVNTQLLAKVDHLMKVSKNSFRPPPKVDSSVVRIEPRNPPPPVDFVEWDGLVRLCFNRKNKTLGAVFRQKPLLQLLADNLKTHRALQGAMRGGMAGEAAPGAAGARGLPADAFMDMDEDAPAQAAARPRGAGGGGELLREVAELVEGVLTSTGFSEERTAKMDQDDFLKLLAAFNEKGIHFAGC
jgi:18S rRNA (adenine1779-N6/adenine1780-N6)-dimethyltransferase